MEEDLEDLDLLTLTQKLFFLLKENPSFTDLDIHCESAYTRHGTKHREYLSEPGRHGPTL